MKQRANRPTLFGFLITFGVWLAAVAALSAGGMGCIEKCSPLINKSAQGRTYLAKKVVEDYFESIIEFDLDNKKYVCDTVAIKVRFKNLSEYHILETNFGDRGSEISLSNWFSFRVLTRTRNKLGGVVAGMYYVYVKLMPDGSYKIFAILPEAEAPFWERVNKKIKSSDPCGFPPELREKQ
jgi:hypothetical protein